MDQAKAQRADDDDPAFLKARALALAMVAIRRAQGKPNPNDFPIGSVEWTHVIADFAADLMRVPPDILQSVIPKTRNGSAE
ncbi:hypothetical protein [Caballeronia sp. DA-9]|uniref:hypothetical protein n=1 Tax=Caballeronia sp. DA-9 TaxID=3436237 RepID=UPI003F671FF7